MSRIELGEIWLDVVRKDIKHLHLSVVPPTGRVRIAAPHRMKLDTIRVFAITKLSWIRAQQQKVMAQEREPQREYIDRESHYLWGQRLLLKVVELEAAPMVEVAHRKLVLQVRPGTTAQRRQALLDQWYRAQIRQALPALVTRWQDLLGVQVARVYVQRMKTRWGSCTSSTGTIRLNTELARKPRECLEYIVAHEMAHLLQPNHGPRFVAQLDRLMPQWAQHRDALNRLPLRQEDWAP